jgi:cob(I)alamin adenosyltransferase
MARIYTRTGDKGETGLFGGVRLHKDAIRIQAYGTIDELNAVLGLVRSELIDEELDSQLQEIQNDLFTLGADLATIRYDAKISRINMDQVSGLESVIDRFEKELPPLTSFILPGGSRAGALMHFARTVARRGEREIVTLARNEQVNDAILPYVNRLSDLLFVLARIANHRQKKPETQWHGKS